MNAIKDRIIDDLNGVRRDRFGRTIDVPVIGDGRKLTWSEIEGLTAGATGTFNTPCPYCGPDNLSSPRFQIERATLQRVAWRCFYCGVHGVLRKKGRADPEAEAAAKKLAEERDRDKRAINTGRALRIWDEARPVAGTLAETYLRARAIHDLPPNVDDVLRYHPRCPFEKGIIAPCLVALFRDISTDARVAIHRTWVTREGKALGRRTLGSFKNAAVKLWPLDGDHLVIGEGIETVLAAATHDLWCEPLRPAWSVAVAENLKRFPVIKAVRELRILVDNDANGVGPTKAETCAARWLGAGKRVVRLAPPRAPHLKKVDINDLVRGASQ